MPRCDGRGRLPIVGVDGEPSIPGCDGSWRGWSRLHGVEFEAEYKGGRAEGEKETTRVARTLRPCFTGYLEH